MERMERTARAGAAIRSSTVRARTTDEFRDVPAWDVIDVPASTIDALREEVSALRERLAQAAPRRVMVEMDKAISLLNRRVEDIREAGAAESDGRERSFIRELGELKAALQALKNPERFRAMEAGLDALGHRIDLLGARAVDPVEVARLQGQLAELKDLVSRAVAGTQAHGGLPKIAERLAACAEDVSRAGEDAARRVADATVAFERNAVALLTRVEQMQARAQAGDASVADDLRRSLLAALEGVHRRLDEVSSQVSQQVAALSPAIGAELTQRLGSLHARITAAEEAGRSSVAPLADVVERHLLTLTEQFRDTHVRLSRLDDMESSLNRMVEEMRQVRESTHTATADAVRAVAAKVSEDAGGPAVVGLKRGLAALEARQDEIERRTSELLADPYDAEFDDVAVPLGRETTDTWAPQAPSPREPEPAPDIADVKEPAFADFEPADAPRVHAAGLREERPQAPLADAPAPQAQESASPLAGDLPWPRARSADRSQGAPTVDADQRPRVGKRRPLGKAEPRGERKPKPNAFARRRHVAMVALIAGATTIFAGTAVGLAWRNGPDLLSSVTSAVRRLAEPMAAVAAPADLPAAIGTPALQAAARSGDPQAAYVVARRYAEGGDIDAAIKWLGFSTAQGYAPAAHRLGAIYETEKRDLGEARRFYEWAASQGNVRSMHALAMLLSEGLGADAKPDWDQAVRWFRTAAELGHRDSQYNLGVVYARGLGVAADIGAAWKWLSLAAAQGDEDSARKRDILAREIDPSTLVRAVQQASDFVPGTQNAAANLIPQRPDWESAPGGDGVASAPAGGATQMASRSTTAGK
ncbi:hypothetical protein ACI7BZ_10875 [Xanthobacter sp. AM11]|uniref:hypothetical protein n=1 Tax=Xanthobacter sp. AM11 TaxID=3380643 RepID=UPI0039BF257F